MITPTRFRTRWIAGLAIALAIWWVAVPANADELPLSPPPTATLTCVDGMSTLTIHWPIGEYGDFNVGDLILGDVSGPGGTFTTPTDQTFPVPNGWQAGHSTVRLNRDTVGDTSYNQDHLSIDGDSCPFSTPVTASIACAGRTLATSIPSGHVTAIAVYDQDGTLLFARHYPRYSLFGVLLEGVQVGPVVITAPQPIPVTATSVRVDITVDNTFLSTSLDTSCIPPEVVVRGVDGEIHEHTDCDGVVTTDLTAGTITVERTGADAAAITVQLAFTGALSNGLPVTVHLEPGQNQVVVPVESDAPGSVQVTVVGGTGYAVGGSGYLVGARRLATVRVPVVVSDALCDDPFGAPTDAGGGSGGTGSPTGTDAPAAPSTTVVPLGPTSAPPADVITGVAHLAG